MKSLLSLLAILFAVQFSYAQWTTSGTNTTTTNTIGIGTTSPGFTLDVVSSSTNISRFSNSAGSIFVNGSAFNELVSRNSANTGYQDIDIRPGSMGQGIYLKTSGSVGVGTTAPESGFKLDVNGLGAIGTQSSARIYMGTTDATHAFIQARDNSVNQNLSFSAASYNFDVGNVAIGTTTIPTGYKLAVNGDIIATKVVVLPHANWPDYVFKPQYKLPSLTDVKSYIDQNQHLPDMPSESEVAKDGIDLGEIVKIQTKKIEELTLYLIAKDREMNEMKDQKEKQSALNGKLEDEIQNLKNQFQTLKGKQ